MWAGLRVSQRLAGISTSLPKRAGKERVSLESLEIRAFHGGVADTAPSPSVAGASS